MPSLDTNLLLRWLLDDVPEQTQAVDRLFSNQKELAVSDLALVETVYVMERVMGISRPAITTAINTLIGRANILMHRNLWTEALRYYQELPKLSITDIFLVVQAEANGSAPLLTFDRKLANQMSSAKLL